MIRKSLFKPVAALALSGALLFCGMPGLEASAAGDLLSVFSAGSPTFIYQVSSVTPPTAKLVRMDEVMPDGVSYDNYTGAYVLPTTVSEGGAFGNTYTVTEIAGSNITAYSENGALRGTPVESVVLPSSLLRIGDSAFLGCTELRSVTIPSSVQSIASSAFVGCTALEELTLSVTQDATLYSPVLFNRVTLPKTIDNLDVSANLSVRGAVTIPDRLTISQGGSVTVETGAVLTLADTTQLSGRVRLKTNAQLVNRTGSIINYIDTDGSVRAIGSGKTAIGSLPNGNEEIADGQRPQIVMNYGGTVAIQQAGQAIYIQAFDGYEVEQVIINGKNMGTLVRYSFQAASSSNIVNITFREKEKEEQPAPIDPLEAFTDLTEDAYYLDAVSFMVSNRIFLGVSNTEFAPKGAVTRGMFATVLHRLKDYNISYAVDCNTPASYIDVPQGKWYSQAAQWAGGLRLTQGIVTGDSFEPDTVLTREQFASILFQFTHALGYDTTVDIEQLKAYNDADKISLEFQEAMIWAVTSGHIDGKLGNLLDPQGEISRAEVSTILMRYLNTL